MSHPANDAHRMAAIIRTRAPATIRMSAVVLR